MDPIIDRLGNLFRSFFQDDDIDNSFDGESSDQDMKDAWDELNDFLKGGNGSSTTSHASGTGRDRTYKRQGPPPPEALRKDYENLEVPFGSPLKEIKTSHRKLLRKFHPDRFANDPERLHAATELSKKINQSYQRIRTYFEKGTL
ncbi:MAG: J domain-containing protein [Spirochaetales bacterium]|nr:J domain-containing protein [Spirochaetales bacterium]